MQRVMAPRGLARCLATDTAARTRRAPRGRHVVVPRSMGVVGRANVRRAWWGAAGLPGASTTSGAVSPGAWGRSAGGSCPPQGRAPPTAWALGAARPGPGPRRPRPGAASAPPAARRQGGPAQAPATRPSPGRAHLSAPGGGPRPHARGHGRQAVPSASVRGAPLCRRAAGGLAGRAQRASPGVAVLGLGAVRQVPVGLGPGGQALWTPWAESQGWLWTAVVMGSDCGHQEHGIVGRALQGYHYLIRQTLPTGCDVAARGTVRRTKTTTVTAHSVTFIGASIVA